MHDLSINFVFIWKIILSEKTLVSTAVGFFHDLVGGDASKTQAGLHMSSKNRHVSQSNPLSNANTSNLASETKEQIEWLHFEYFTLLDSSSSNASSASSNSSTTTSTNTSSSTTTNNDSKSSAKQKFLNSPFANSNILLVIGYKTGFSIWSIDVSFKKRIYKIPFAFEFNFNFS